MTLSELHDELIDWLSLRCPNLLCHEEVMEDLASFMMRVWLYAENEGKQKGEAIFLSLLQKERDRWMSRVSTPSKQ